MNFLKKFDNQSKIVITFEEHSKENPIVQVFILQDGVYSIVGVDIEVSDNNDVKISASKPFSGKVHIA